jgi:hypothetical protein
MPYCLFFAPLEKISHAIFQKIWWNRLGADNCKKPAPYDERRNLCEKYSGTGELLFPKVHILRVMIQTSIYQDVDIVFIVQL